MIIIIIIIIWWLYISVIIFMILEIDAKYDHLCHGNGYDNHYSII